MTTYTHLQRDGVQQIGRPQLAAVVQEAAPLFFRRVKGLVKGDIGVLNTIE